MAGWQSGHAAACKAVYAGSIPTSASIANIEKAPLWRFFFVVGNSAVERDLDRLIQHSCCLAVVSVLHRPIEIASESRR
jgi:hypothetical protein